jgi:hypothetical protein
MGGKSIIGQIYAYVVCLGLTVGLVIMTFAGLSGLFKLILPDYTMTKNDYMDYRRLVGQEAHIASKSVTASDVSEGSVAIQDSAAGDFRVKRKISTDRTPSRARVTAAEMLDAQRRQGVSALIDMAVALLICLPLFWVHFRWAKKLATHEADARIMRRRYPAHRQSRRYNPKPNSQSNPNSPKSG